MYWNTRSLESFVIMLGSTQIVFQSRFEFWKNFCSTIEKKVLNHQIQLKCYSFLCYSIGSDNKFDDFLLIDGPGKPDYWYSLSLL